jgi:sulfur-oxidizing protein SoxZ
MPDPTRIRCQLNGDKVAVRVIMAHEMETGLRRDIDGQLVPAWFIQRVTATWNGQVVLTAQWGASVARNPFLQFNVKGARAGDRIEISWSDNKGGTRTDSATVS